MEPCIESKVHLAKSHKLFNKIFSSARILTAMKLSSLSLREEPLASGGVEKVPLRMRQAMPPNLVLFLLQVLPTTLDSRKVQRQKNSGMLSAARPLTAQSKKWELLQALKRDFLMSPTVRATPT